MKRSLEAWRIESRTAPDRFGKTRGRSWTHPLILGLRVAHCGHPTALRPYYLTTDGRDVIGGRAYYNLADAQRAALVLAGLAQEVAE